MLKDGNSQDTDYINNNDINQYIWSRADFELMDHLLSSVDWREMLYCNPDALEFWSAVEATINRAIEMYVPQRSKSYCVNQRRKSKCYPRNIQKIAAEKKRLWRQLRSDRNNSDLLEKYKNCANTWRHLLNEFQKQTEQKVIEANNIGTFYNYISKRISHRSRISALVNRDGDAVTDDKTKADMFSEFFASVCTVDDGSRPNCVDVSDSVQPLDNVEFSVLSVATILRKLKSSYSSGPDGLPPLLFKKLFIRLAEPLSIAFTQLMSVGAVPVIWKSAVITPLFKKGVAGDVSNYRPISLTCVPCKVMERIISHEIYQHLVDNNILHPAQHGFLKGHSTNTNLLESFNDWTLSLQYKHYVNVVYIDFRKAFDTVSHEKLFIRLSSYGITGMLLKWLQNFLTNRTHRTKVGSCLSAEHSLLSGIIQGSGIGPILFLLFINELAFILEQSGVKIKLFADDCKIYAEIVDFTDIAHLQDALNKLVEWSKIWQLDIAIDKCCMLSIGRCHQSTSSPHTYTISDIPLPTVDHCRDLGIIVSDNLQPRLHINTIVAKASQRSNAILRCFLSRDVNVLIQAFKVYVRPLLEFNTTVWSPTLKKDIIAVERVQRSFTKRLPGLKEVSYTDRLTFLSIDSLELRRLHYDLVLCYQIIFNLIALRREEFLTLNTASVTRGHQFKLAKLHSRGVRRKFFTNRIINVWNYLPADVVDFNSLNSFRQSLYKVDFSRFLVFS